MMNRIFCMAFLGMFLSMQESSRPSILIVAINPHLYFRASQLDCTCAIIFVSWRIALTSDVLTS
jgi:hypothetical protein